MYKLNPNAIKTNTDLRDAIWLMFEAMGLNMSKEAYNNLSINAKKYFYDDTQSINRLTNQ